MNDTYQFGDSTISFQRGYKKPNDYLIRQNGIQIKDDDIFNQLLKAIKNEEQAKYFLDAFAQCEHLEFKAKRIESDCTSRDSLYKYTNEAYSNPDLSELLFISILRCDIDNICYKAPLNGGVRFFAQILLVFAYTFKWDNYVATTKQPHDIPNHVYSLGFNKEKEYFTNIYQIYLQER